MIIFAVHEFRSLCPWKRVVTHSLWGATLRYPIKDPPLGIYDKTAPSQLPWAGKVCWFRRYYRLLSFKRYPPFILRRNPHSFLKAGVIKGGLKLSPFSVVSSLFLIAIPFYTLELSFGGFFLYRSPQLRSSLFNCDTKDSLDQTLLFLLI